MVLGNEDYIKQSTSSVLLLYPFLKVVENSAPHRAGVKYFLGVSKNS